MSFPYRQTGFRTQLSIGTIQPRLSTVAYLSLFYLCLQRKVGVYDLYTLLAETERKKNQTYKVFKE